LTDVDTDWRSAIQNLGLPRFVFNGIAYRRPPASSLRYFQHPQQSRHSLREMEQPTSGERPRFVSKNVTRKFIDSFIFARPSTRCRILPKQIYTAYRGFTNSLSSKPSIHSTTQSWGSTRRYRSEQIRDMMSQQRCSCNIYIAIRTISLNHPHPPHSRLVVCPRLSRRLTWQP
jgi:hypothetical protein